MAAAHEVKHNPTQPNLHEIKVLRLGIQRNPPAIVVEYVEEPSGADRKLQHRIWCDSRVSEHRTKDLIHALKNHPTHGAYVKNVCSSHLKVLFQRVLQVCAETKPPVSPKTESIAAKTSSGNHYPILTLPVCAEAEPPVSPNTEWTTETNPDDTTFSSTATKGNANRRSRTTPATPLRRGSSKRDSVVPSVSPAVKSAETPKQHHQRTGEEQVGPQSAKESESAADDGKVLDTKSPLNIAVPDDAKRCDVLPIIGAIDRSDRNVNTDVRPSDGETWPSFLARAQERLGSLQKPSDVFEKFRTTDDLGLTFACFARLFHLATAPSSAGGQARTSFSTMAPPWESEVPGRPWRHPYEPIRLITAGNWKAERVWKLFDTRCSRPEYSETSHCGKGSRFEGKYIVVVGAGPCGLRAAIELRLLGASVVVVEKREAFTRINQLHLWKWCADELKQLGAKCVEPPPSDFGADPDKLHICIGDLQKLLLKIALILGVEVYLGVEYRGCEWVNHSWTVKLRQNTANADHPSPGAPSEIRDVAALLGASGLGCKIGKDAGIESIMTDHLGAESAIGVVFNFCRTHGPAEGRLRSFAMARQFYKDLFKKLEEETGAELENIVHVKGHISHYFVMTPSRRCLVKTGVARDQGLELKGDNIDKSKLDAFVRKVAAFPFKPGQSPSKPGEPSVYQALLDDRSGQEPDYVDNGPMVFDFSKMCRSGEGLVFVPPPNLELEGEANEGDHLLVGVVGDALIEPFWPEGLGISRGFLGVWDSCSAIAEWGSGQDRFHVGAHFQEAFMQLKQLSAATQGNLLTQQEHKFTFALAPSTRYRAFDVARRKTRSNSESPKRERRGRTMTMYADSD